MINYRYGRLMSMIHSKCEYLSKLLRRPIKPVQKYKKFTMNMKPFMFSMQLQCSFRQVEHYTSSRLACMRHKFQYNLKLFSIMAQVLLRLLGTWPTYKIRLGHASLIPMILNLISKPYLQHFVVYGILWSASLSFASALINGQEL